MTRKSFIEWAAHWIGDDAQRKRFTTAFTAELDNWQPKPAEPVYCKNCPFAEHVHFEQGGKLVAPGCSGFEARS